MTAALVVAMAAPPLAGADQPPGFPAPVRSPGVSGEEAFELGRWLFYDRRLSYNRTQSCADCHQQRLAFSDGRSKAVGSTGQEHPRNAMSLTNVAYNASYTWRGTSIRTLEEQALVPLLSEHPVELGVRGHRKEIIARLRADPDYRQKFALIFGGAEPITLRNIAAALAAFERALISGRSPYDRLVYGGDERALSAQAWRGMQLFYSRRAGCSSCHRGFNFSGEVRFAGREAVTPRLVSNRLSGGRFRIPTLRNIALTAPYMHDGSIPTLEGVVNRYVEVRRLGLSPEEKEDLVAFLRALTDPAFINDARFADPRPEQLK